MIPRQRHSLEGGNPEHTKSWLCPQITPATPGFPVRLRRPDNDVAKPNPGFHPGYGTTGLTMT